MSHYSNTEETDDNLKKKPCRSCMDFKSWTNRNNKSSNISKESPSEDSTKKKVQSLPAPPSEPAKDCPPDITELGRSSWSLLHSIAANYPEKPNNSQQKHATQFITSFAQLYPCESCAKDLREDLQGNTPDTSSRLALSQWMCQLHNTVNKKLGKPEFDCKLVMERWLDGWKDGSCD